MERPLFLNDWADAALGEILLRFGISVDDLAGAEVLLASYSQDLLGGEAFLLLGESGRLFEVNASHDSSGDMTGQWEPEETMIEALKYRLSFGRLGRAEDGRDLFAAALERLLDSLGRPAGPI